MSNDLAGIATKLDLLAQGFVGFKTVRELRKSIIRSEELNQRGVYAVICQPNYKPTFIDPEKTRQNHNVITPWSLEKLQKKWVSGVEVLYIGIAGTDIKQCSLRRRITDLIRHSQGKTTKQGPHRGGELLWQLKGSENFEVGYLPTKTAKKEETRLINLFYLKTGKLPFANRIPKSYQKQIQQQSRLDESVSL